MEELEKQIADLKARLPRHSVPLAMLMELEELEDELDRRRQDARRAVEPREDRN